MNNKAYLIDGVIGNSKLLLSMHKNGQVSRMWWPSIDLYQHADEISDGVYVEDARDMLWRNEGEWEYSQGYIKDTNILKSKALHLKYNIEIESIDFCTLRQDIVVKKYIIKNNSSKGLDLKFIFKSGFAIKDSIKFNSLYFDKENDALVHYKQDCVLAVGSSEEISEYTVSNVKDQAELGKLNGDDTAQGTEGALLFELNQVDSGEERVITIFITPGRNKEDALRLLQNAKKLKAEKLYCDTEKYWNEYLNKANNIDIIDDGLQNLYKRSLLAIALMYNKETGGFLAAPEFDEYITKSGGYGFCWPRDGAFIANAMLKAGYENMSKNFYEWAVNVQEKEGFWDQRYYMSGLKAPTWGVQIDETASVVWGMNEYYKQTGDNEFIKYIWDSVYKAAEFLCNSIDSETNLPIPTMDLWEERKGEHTYSCAAVEAGLRGAANIAKELGYNEYEKKWRICSEKIKESIEYNLWNSARQSFYRGVKLIINRDEYDKLKGSNEKVYYCLRDGKYDEYLKYYDDVVDVSLLGISYPFKTLEDTNEKMIKQGEAVEKYLWVNKVGGIKRYENDAYIGGNPWILTTLWLAIHYSNVGNREKAQKLVEWAVEHRTYLDLLPEQIDKESGEIAWVVPLAWSHAMFILSMLEIYDN
ncbi:glycoside hydrolase family 15 protein [Clostridium brassicae]|uniref:Glycoside hydrolase family 15 protein n=1 Tax=Clostridium brassicae TaxID=2999072 RepID=A0ABT4D8L1_9CLOT|nr:glycoside hydrolase family 15 protein [Clostridium brassicae]MCY6958649.1 glycoside hydrolase family 15 protein [Clostridium brassicae]